MPLSAQKLEATPARTSGKTSVEAKAAKPARSRRIARMDEEKTFHPITTGDPVSDTVKFLTERPPAHYILQIEAFSFLVDMVEDPVTKNYDSMTFEASGYKWKLCIYPDGDQKGNGKGFVSLSVRLVTDSLPAESKISVNCTFFVLDQIQEKYLTFQDVSAKIGHLHVLNKETELTRLMQRDVFEDEKNGYLVEDKCVFGVEISVSSSIRRGECIALPVKLRKCFPRKTTYTWKIDGYSKTDDKRLSEVFIRQDYQWRLQLFPKGSNSEKGKSLSLYLESLDCSATLSVYAEFKLCMKDQMNGKDVERTVSHLFTCSEDDWGFKAFISLDDINNASKGLLMNDTLIVEVEFVRISAVKGFTEN